MGTIREEIRQTRPFASVAEEATITLLRTADRLRTALDRVVEPRGITGQQYNVLRILRGAGDAGLPTLEIAARMIEHSPGITRLLDRLEARALVRRRRCPQDRRQVLCFITPAGRELLAPLDRPVTDASERHLGMLGRGRLAELIGMLDAVRATLASSDAVPGPGRTDLIPGKSETGKRIRSKERRE
jgi:DNA-binding MarR family transcriptional regulator